MTDWDLKGQEVAWSIDGPCYEHLGHYPGSGCPCTEECTRHEHHRFSGRHCSRCGCDEQGNFPLMAT